MITSHAPSRNRKRVAASIALALFISAGPTLAPSTANLTPIASAADCKAGHNLGDIADSYISRCRKASVRREFPKEFLNKTLAQIKSTPGINARKAWKLLNDKRWNR